ncbi:putative 20S proteasome beta subunit D2 [Cryptosporidium canis]|nr:putative 20S proteasome beta subunit D2 [Cryptosporidium canis]
MDSLIGIKGPDFVVLASDTVAFSNVFRLSLKDDKIMEVDENKLIGVGGTLGDRMQFGEYIKCNLNLYRLRNGVQLSTTATANFTRNELADLLRSDPHNVNILVGGYTKEEGPKLFWMDELASMGNVNNAAHGYGGLLVTGILDKYYKPNITQEEALDILIKCSEELKTRFLLSQYSLFVKIVDCQGVKVLKIENGTAVPVMKE